MRRPDRVILIDDDALNNQISQYVINKVSADLEILAFLLPEKAIEFIESSYNTETDLPTLVLLDINMPIMSGWEFLQRYDRLSLRVREQFVIYLLSSSVDQRDMVRARENVNLAGFLVKPLLPEMIRNILNGFAQASEDPPLFLK